MSGRGFSYFAQTPGLPLSLKCMFNGRALYKFGRSEVAVDDLGYLILNDQQPYSIEIASPTRVETFVLWFPQNWAEEVLRSFDKPPETLLANPSNEIGASATFFERYTPHDNVVSPKVHALRAAFKGTQTIEDGWLEEKLRELLAAMLASQQTLKREVGNLPASAQINPRGIVATRESGPGLSARAPGPAGVIVRGRHRRLSVAVSFAQSFPQRIRSNAAPVPESSPIGAGEISSGKNSDPGDGNLFGMRL